MILYHGSNLEVYEPKLLEIQRQLDFGKGFYTTTDLQQAVIWAKRTTRIRKKGKPCVSVYKFDEKLLHKLQVLRFENANEEWLAFVTANRRGQSVENGWDLIWGPVANDQTMQTLLLYLDGFLTEKEAIARLLPQNLKDQVVLKTQAALECLQCKEVQYYE